MNRLALLRARAGYSPAAATAALAPRQISARALRSIGPVRGFAAAKPKVKRAKTSYVFYVKEHLSPTRERLLGQGVDKSVANRQAMTLLGQNWRNASPMEKAKYEEMAARDKVERMMSEPRSRESAAPFSYQRTKSS